MNFSRVISFIYIDKYNVTNRIQNPKKIEKAISHKTKMQKIRYFLHYIIDRTALLYITNFSNLINISLVQYFFHHFSIKAPEPVKTLFGFKLLKCARDILRANEN